MLNFPRHVWERDVQAVEAGHPVSGSRWVGVRQGVSGGGVGHLRQLTHNNSVLILPANLSNLYPKRFVFLKCACVLCCLFRIMNVS